MRRLFYDIETSPNVVLSWRAGYKINISHDSILKERAVICICYKWEGENKVHSLTWDDDQNDREMLEIFIEIANTADELVGHYIDGFDMPWVRTRCLFHGIDALPLYKTIDTKAWASRHFYFNSNKLDYIAKFLGMGGKIETNYDLWKDVLLKNCPKALDKMVRYCKKDIVLLEKVWSRMQKAVPHHSHAGVSEGLEKFTCPRCASENVILSKTKTTARGTKQYQMQCKACGGYYTISEPSFKKYLASKNR